MKIRKFISLLCFLSLVCTGCGNSGSEKKSETSPEKPVAITIWHYYNGVQQENFDNAVKEFNETAGHDKGIVVEAYGRGSISELSDDILASIRQDAGADDIPDMFTAYSETAYTADKLGMVADLSGYFTEDELSQYVDGYIEEGYINAEDCLKIFPTAKSTEVMMLNMTDWEKFAESENVTQDALKTWEGVVETAEKYYNYTDSLTPDVENDGKAFFGRDSVANYMFVGAKQLGAELITENNGDFSLNIDENTVRKLWENYYVPYVKGYFTAQSRYRSDDAKIGEIIALICSTTGTAYFPDSVTIDDDYSYPIEAVVMPVPNFEGTDPCIVQQGAGMVVTKSDEKTEKACTEFLRWFTEDERNIGFSVGSGYMPVKKDANDAELILSGVSGNEEENKILLESLKIAIDEIKSYNLYTVKPFENTANTRDFIGDFIHDSAVSAHEEALARIESGEDREEIMDEMTSDEAFNKWFDEFSAGLHTVSAL
ncbi:MAG: extracellular solute-binding protein [Ruminococcus sp.]|nr:extracellular solute-binding protein [Ruminococcus sp.]